MTTLLDPPIVSELADAREAVGSAASVALWSLTDTELAVEVGQALALRAQAEAVLLARVGEAEARGLARSRGASSMTAWLRGSHRLGPGEASRLVRTARTLRDQLPATAQALAAGDLHLSQVEVIVESLNDLPADLDPALRAEGEQTLLGACASLDPIGLGRLGRRLEELLDPEGVQDRDEAAIRDHENRAYGKREFTVSPDRTGPAAASAAATTRPGPRSSPRCWTRCPRPPRRDRMGSRTPALPGNADTTPSSKCSAGTCSTPPPTQGTGVRPRSGSPSPSHR